MSETTVPTEYRPQIATPAPLLRLREEIDRLFEDFSLARPSRSIFSFGASAALSPAMELAPTSDGYELSVELPGLDEKDVEVEFADGVLSVSGDKREESEKKENGYLLSERRYGSFRREVTLPADVDPDTIAGKFEQGVLKLAMKKDKNAENRTKKIKIG